MKKTFFILLITTIFVLALSITEFKLSRRQLLDSFNQPGPSINLISFPTPTSPAPTTTKLYWSINVSAPTDTHTTSIYYDYVSTPSAVTVNDSPDALGYRFHTTDYSQGDFPLPRTFDANIVLPSPGTVYFRAYTYLNGQNLWTPEHQILVY
jgi:hypothetical protein